MVWQFAIEDRVEDSAVIVFSRRLGGRGRNISFGVGRIQARVRGEGDGVVGTILFDGFDLPKDIL